MIRKIVPAGDARLRQRSKPVKKLDAKIYSLIKDLKDTLRIQKDPEGVGLAAPQIGKNVQIFLMDHEGFSRVVINPKIIRSLLIKTPAQKTKKKIMEGCLSLPHYYGPLKRANFVKLEYLNESGEKTTEEFKDFLAQIVLHEMDHLEGLLFVDRLLEQKQPLYKYNKGEWEEVEL